MNEAYVSARTVGAGQLTDTTGEDDSLTNVDSKCMRSLLKMEEIHGERGKE